MSTRHWCSQENCQTVGGSIDRTIMYRCCWWGPMINNNKRIEPCSHYNKHMRPKMPLLEYLKATFNFKQGGEWFFFMRLYKMTSMVLRMNHIFLWKHHLLLPIAMALDKLWTLFLVYTLYKHQYQSFRDWHLKIIISTANSSDYRNRFCKTECFCFHYLIIAINGDRIMNMRKVSNYIFIPWMRWQVTKLSRLAEAIYQDVAFEER